MTSINTPNINFKWDPKSLEIRTLAVERLLEPLVTQVIIRVAISVSALVCVFISFFPGNIVTYWEDAALPSLLMFSWKISDNERRMEKDFVRVFIHRGV